MRVTHLTFIYLESKKEVLIIKIQFQPFLLVCKDYFRRKIRRIY